jgi:hypothetical protein
MISMRQTDADKIQNHRMEPSQEVSTTVEPIKDVGNSEKTVDKCQRILTTVKLGIKGNLFEQLDAQTRDQQLQDLGDILIKTTSLYSGELFVVDEDTLLLYFENHSIVDAGFQAICCAYLLQQATERKKLLLTPRVTISERNGIVDVAHKAAQSHLICDQNQSSDFLIEKNLLENTELAERIEFLHSDNIKEAFVLFKGFRQNYLQLLKNQLERILPCQKPLTDSLR